MANWSVIVTARALWNAALNIISGQKSNVRRWFPLGQLWPHGELMLVKLMLAAILAGDWSITRQRRDYSLPPVVFSLSAHQHRMVTMVQSIRIQ